MSIPAKRPLLIDGKELGTIYSFEKGDILPLHTHDEATNHYSILSEGVLVPVAGMNADQAQMLVAPLIMNWDVGEMHGFEALTEATLVNVLKRP